MPATTIYHLTCGDTVVSEKNLKNLNHYFHVYKNILKISIILLSSFSICGCLEHSQYIEIKKVNLENFNIWDLWQTITYKLGVNSSNTIFGDFVLSFCEGRMTNFYLSFIEKEGKNNFYSYNVYLAKISPDKYLFTYDRGREKNCPINFPAEKIFHRIGLWNVSKYIEKSGLNKKDCEIEMDILVNTGISEGNGSLIVFKREGNSYIKTTGNLVYQEGKSCMRIMIYGTPVAYYEIL